MRTLIAKNGERIYRRIDVKVFLPDGTFKRERLQAPPKSGFSPENIDKALTAVADNIERQFPQFDYRLVPLSAYQFNFVCVGPRP